MTMFDPLIAPFTDFAFMRRALAACLVLALGGVPLGLFLSLRRMTLAGDAMSHAILPGVALGFLCCGLSLWAMTLGGMVAAVIVAGAAVALTRMTRLPEDSALLLVYLLSLSVGVVLVSLRGSQLDLIHLLLGNVLAIEPNGLGLMTATACLSLVGVAILYRRLVVDGFDPDFMRAVDAHGGSGRKSTDITRHVFFGLLMINLVAAFQALGTLMALGLMLLPVMASRFWARSIEGMIVLGYLVAALASYGGLLLSYYVRLPPAPAIVAIAGTLALASAIFGRR